MKNGADINEDDVYMKILDKYMKNINDEFKKTVFNNISEENIEKNGIKLLKIAVEENMDISVIEKLISDGAFKNKSEYDKTIPFKYITDLDKNKARKIIDLFIEHDINIYAKDINIYAKDIDGTSIVEKLEINNKA